MKQLHKKFTNFQIKDLMTRYLKKEIARLLDLCMQNPRAEDSGGLSLITVLSLEMVN